MKHLISILLILCLWYSAMGQVLHYDRPAQCFEEALVIGNGTFGGTIYGNTRYDRISLNDITLWTGEPDHTQWDSAANVEALRQVRDALYREDYQSADILNRKLQGHYSENYQPLGQLKIKHHYWNTKMPMTGDPDINTKKYFRWLDISNAIAGCRYKVGNQIEVTKDYFCSNPDQVMVVRIRCNHPLSISLEMDCQLPHNVSTDNNELIVDGYAAYHSLPHYTNREQMFWYDSTRGIHFRTIVKAIEGETTYYQEGSMTVRGENEIVLLIANATSFNGFDMDPVREGADYKRIVRERIDNASQYSYSQLFGRHVKDYKKYYDRVKIDLGRTPRRIAKLPTDEQLRRYSELEENNPDLEELYFQFGRYLLISSSRTPGVPANLQGLWNEQILPPWSSNYTTNINLEENYWPAEVANLGEMHLPLLSFLKNVQTNGSVVARQMYGVENGWCLGHNSDIWAMANPVGEQSGDPCWANWNMGGAWLSTHIWEHFLFIRDTAFLLEYYPVLRGAAEFCHEWLQSKGDILIPSPSTSPENKYLTPNGVSAATLYGGTADLAMIRQCLMDAVHAALVLRVDHELQSQLEDDMGKLPPYQIGNKGNLQEWYYDWDDAEPTHRHQSHLYGLYPGNSISPFAGEQEDLLKACAKSLELRGTETTGWSTGWRINLYARLRDGENAYSTLRRLLRYVEPGEYKGGTYPNMLDAHSPFQIDGNFGGTAGICEMLLQSTCEPAPVVSRFESRFDCLYSLTIPQPALPKAWKKGYVKGLRSRSGKTYDIVWNKGKAVLKYREQ